MNSSDSTSSGIRAICKLTKENYAQWKREVFTMYATQAQDISDLGLKDVLMNDAQYLAAAGTAVRPDRALPAEPPGNASGAAVALYTRKCSNIKTVKRLLAELKIELLDSIGPTNVAKLRDPVHDTQHITPLQIIQAMEVKYGPVASTTLSAWREQLAKPIAASVDLEDFLAYHKNLHDNFASVKQVMSEYAKIEAVAAALSTRPAAIAALQRYRVDTPDLSDQTYKDLADYLETQAPNMVVSAAAMNYSAHSAGKDFDALIADAVAKALPAAVAAAMAPYAAAMHAIPPAATSTTRHQPQVKTTHKYCYRHGYCGHLGADCDILTKDPRYTIVMINTKDHNAVPGGSVKVYK